MRETKHIAIFSGDNWPYAGTIDKAIEFGAEVVEMGVDEVCIDEKNKIITSPAYMFNGKFHEIHDGVAKMVQEIVNIMWTKNIVVGR